MCTRFYIERNNPLLLPLIQDAEKSVLIRRFLERKNKSEDQSEKSVSPVASGEVRPTDIAPVLAPDRNGSRAVFPMKWGYRLNDRTTLFNARTETASIKPLFKKDWASHRCIIPASWYYEWDHSTKEKYAIQPADQQVTWLCGLYHIEDGLPYFVILTREPGLELKKIHDRMPLILPYEHIDEWIRPETDPHQLLDFALTDPVFRSAGSHISDKKRNPHP